MPTLIILFNMVLEVLATTIRPKKKKIQIEKKEVKLSLSVNYKILYTDTIYNPKDATKNY